MSSSTSSSGSKKKEEEKKKTKKSTTKDKKKEEKSAGKEKKSSSKDKKKEKKDKKSSASPDKKKTKKKTTTSKEGASPAETATMKKTGADYLPAIKKWLDSKSNTQGIEYVKTDDKKHRFHFKIGGEELAFTVSFPVEADDIWSVASDELAEEWATETNEMAMAATSATDVLKYATQQFEALSDAEFSEGEEEEEEDYDDFDDDLGLEKVERDKGPKQKYMPEPEIDTSKFHIPAGYESSSVQAIIQEYREILKTDREERGYDASPLNDNIAQWELKLFGIPKDEPLWADMQRLGVEYITLHVTFPPNYPFNPPFIRVVRPRFAFRTGHVTVGGSICTLMLTNDGWVATYRLPQVIVDIRAMLTAGGGRLDTSQGSDYSESEAMVAFQRMLSTHGWKHWKA